MGFAGIRLFAYQRRAAFQRLTRTWNCWARQTGKSFTFSLRRLIRALARRRGQIVLSAGLRQSREVMAKAREHCELVGEWNTDHEAPFLAPPKFRVLEIQLDRGARIIGLPANARTCRGYTGDIFLDEFAMHVDDAGIWGALLPTVLRGHGELDVASTPRGRKNTFFRLAGNDLFERSTIRLVDAIADGLEGDAGAMHAAIDDDLLWRQEFCCEFADDATAFLTSELIRTCQDVHLSTKIDWRRLEDRHAEVYVGVDIGRHRDLTAIWIWERRRADLEGGGARRMTGAPFEYEFICRGVVVLERAPFAEQEEAIAAIVRTPSARRACIDASGLGMQLAERLAVLFGEHLVEGVAFTASLKSILAGRLRVLAERGALRIPRDEAIARDWHAISRIVSGPGHVRFDADRAAGGHADRFWAAALGLHAGQDAPTGRLEFETAGRRAFARAGAI